MTSVLPVTSFAMGFAGSDRDSDWTLARQCLDLAADDVFSHLVELRCDLRCCLAEYDVRRCRPGFEAVWEETRRPGASQEPLDLVFDHVACTRDGESDIDWIATAAVEIAAQDVSALLAGRLLESAQTEIHDMIVDVRAFADRGQRRLLGFCHVVEVTGQGGKILDVRVDRLRSVAEFDAGIDDGRELDAPHEADNP